MQLLFWLQTVVGQVGAALVAASLLVASTGSLSGWLAVGMTAAAFTVRALLPAPSYSDVPVS